MTPPDKPQSSDEHSRQDADPTSVMTQAVDDNSAGTQAKGSAADSSRSRDSTAASTAAGEVGDSDSAAGSEASGESDGGEPQSRSGEFPDGTGTPPPWQRTSGVAESSVSSTTSPGAAGSGAGATEFEAAQETRSGSSVSATESRAFTSGAGGAQAETAHRETQDTSNPDAEDTQAIPHPLRDMGQPLQPDSEAAAASESGEASHAERTTVSFTGSGPGRSSSSAPASGARRPSRGPRRASLQLKRLDPWSVLKLALVLSVAMFFVWMIAVAVLYGVLGGMGVWEQLNGTFSELTQPENTVGEPLISAGRVFGAASIIGAVNIVLMTALATVAAFIYNVAADFAGGVEVTLSERE
ncbi:DUF3566 domain-containing protein [Haloactinomyces albus]|uniref:DUF3566 domain-containing protein n=1 Tax=Haloactinomyces albus TaxID=1352928 RepID=A0AAE4CM45_9ACTN|nr:DUF3566 domain-containing protein [Haloactinomyces albus]MDR7302006.1 hypothetical protein [Haloactinomyces albus]